MLPDDWLAQLRAIYPKRDGGGDGKKIVTRLVLKAIGDGAEWDRIMAGARNYAIYCGRKGLTGTDYVLMLQTFVGRDWHFDDWADRDMRTPAQKAEEAQWQALEQRAHAMGFVMVDRSKGLYVAERAIESEEAKRRTNVVQIPRAKIVT